MLAGTIGIVVFILLLVARVPIGFALLLVGFVGVGILVNWQGAFSIISTLFYTRVSNYVYSLLPMFILMGHLASEAGIGDSAYQLAHKWVGNIRGGIAVVTCVAGAFFGAACGSSMASAATLGKLAIPEMRKLGYDDGFSGATVAAAGLLAMTIPPSMMLVIYAVTVSASVGRQLMAGILPGFLTAVMYALVILMWTSIRPGVAPRAVVSVSWKERFVSLKGIFPILILFGSVMLSMYLGIATPTEAGALGVLAALGFTIARKRREWLRTTITAAKETVLTSCFIFIVMAGAAVFAVFLNRTGFVDVISQAVIATNLVPKIKIMLMLLVLIPVGMFLEGLSAMLITLPILFPIAMDLGFDPIWFGIVVMLMIELGLLTPPVGMNVYALVGAVPGVKVGQVFANIPLFCVAILLTVGILIIFPEIATFIPSLMQY